MPSLKSKMESDWSEYQGIQRILTARQSTSANRTGCKSRNNSSSRALSQSSGVCYIRDSQRKHPKSCHFTENSEAAHDAGATRQPKETEEFKVEVSKVCNPIVILRKARTVSTQTAAPKESSNIVTITSDSPQCPKSGTRPSALKQKDITISSDDLVNNSSGMKERRNVMTQQLQGKTSITWNAVGPLLIDNSVERKHPEQPPTTSPQCPQRTLSGSRSFAGPKLSEPRHKFQRSVVIPAPATDQPPEEDQSKVSRGIYRKYVSSDKALNESGKATNKMHDNSQYNNLGTSRRFISTQNLFQNTLENMIERQRKNSERVIDVNCNSAGQPNEMAENDKLQTANGKPLTQPRDAPPELRFDKSPFSYLSIDHRIARNARLVPFHSKQKPAPEYNASDDSIAPQIFTRTQDFSASQMYRKQLQHSQERW